MFRELVLGAAGAAGAVVAVCTASAHVTLETREAAVGAPYKAVLRVPHGCEGAATIALRVRVPDGMIAVKPMPKPGWKVDTVSGKGVAAGFRALVSGLGQAGGAGGHASLVKASPADGAVVPVAPQALSLTFNEPVSPLVIRLIGPDGASIAPRTVVGENNTVTVTAPANFQRGT